MKSVILDTISKIVLPLVLMFALYLLMRGHNAPGGGFIAGVMAGIVIGLQYVAFGAEYASNIFRVNYRTVLALGLLMAVGTGVVSILCGYPFLKSKFWLFHLPFFGEVEIASATFFDIGIFLAVVGGILTIVSTIRR
jgi:multisubunit Na+/H+ antiporter MnhB subunit